MKDWISVKDALPQLRTRCLAYCEVEKKDSRTWSGIIDATFDPHIGWIGCEEARTGIYVTHWMSLPELPDSSQGE